MTAMCIGMVTKSMLMVILVMMSLVIVAHIANDLDDVSNGDEDSVYDVSNGW